jgi:acyl-CoA thioesterase-1
MPKKILILADSLSLPRPETHGNIRYEETYPYLLDVSLRERMGKDAPVVMEQGMRSRTITDVANDWQEYVTWRKPEIVIVHVGITDCAPRVFSAGQRSFIERLPIPFVRRVLLWAVHRYRRQIISLRPPKVYTPFARYRDTLNQLVEWRQRDDVRALVFVNIVEPPDALEQRSPGLQENVRRYNEVLGQLKSRPGVVVVDLNELIHHQGRGEDFLLSDGQHLSVAGNKLLATQLGQLVINAL